LFALLLPAFLAVGLLGQATTADPLSRAMQNPNDDNTITEVMHSYAHSKDPQVISRLSELFRSISDHRLLRNFGMFMWTVVGRRDELYFNVLAGYAREAVTSDAPLPYFLDPDGNAIRQSTAPVAFSNWCQARRLDPGACLTAAGEQTMDVWVLALLKDRRAIPILRQGLNAQNDALAGRAVAGLGMLNDADSIPLIEAAIHRFRPKQQELIASELAQFDDPRVGPLLDEFIKDPKWRQQLDDDIRKRHAEAAKK
jgi:hypothetical protein